MEAEGSTRVSSSHAELLRHLQGSLPPELLKEVIARLREWFSELKAGEARAHEAREQMYYLRSNCSAEEQTRVMLLEKQVPLDHNLSKLEAELNRAQSEVFLAKESKRSINEEIERLNRDLFSEAHKLVAEEVREADALRAKEAIIQDEYERLRSRLMLERDRYTLAAGMVREVCDSASLNFSLDDEILESTALPMFSADAELEEDKASMSITPVAPRKARLNSM